MGIRTQTYHRPFKIFLLVFCGLFLVGFLLFMVVYWIDPGTKHVVDEALKYLEKWDMSPKEQQELEMRLGEVAQEQGVENGQEMSEEEAREIFQKLEMAETQQYQGYYEEDVGGN